MINEAYKYSDVTSKSIGSAMAVHKTLGNGFQEVIYQRALAIEMNLQVLYLVESLKCPYFTERNKWAAEELTSTGQETRNKLTAY